MEGDYRPFGSDSRASPSFWVIATAVCIGSLAASAITWGAAELRLRWELQQVAETMKREAVQSRSALERAQRDAAQEVQRLEQERQRMSVEQRNQLAEQQRQEAEAMRATQMEAARKEAAWKRFYRPSAACIGSAATVECANEHIRAQKEFARRFAAGEL